MMTTDRIQTISLKEATKRELRAFKASGGFVVLTLTCEDIDQQASEFIAGKLGLLTASRDLIEAFGNRLMVIVDETPQTDANKAKFRALITAINHRWPYWAHFCNLEWNQLGAILSALAGPPLLKPIVMAKAQAMLHAMNDLYFRHGFGLERNIARTIEFGEALKNAFPPR